MADISKITTLDGTTYNIKDTTARSSIPSAATATPLVDGTAAVGSSAKYAREDHRHPSDTSRVAKSGDTMTGTLSLPSNKYYESNSESGLNLNNSDIIGVNGIFTADKADSAGEGINFYRDATHWDSFYLKDGKAYIVPNRPKGSAAGTEGEKLLYSIPKYEAGSTTDISMRPLVDRTRANRLAFLPADQIIIEQTVDGGTTWTDAGYTDLQKRYLFATDGASISIPLLNGAKSTLCGIRVTITGMKYNVPDGTAETEKYQYWNSDYVIRQERYFNVREWWFWLSANSDTIRCQIEMVSGSTSEKYNTWVNVFDTDFGMTGWSGSDWIRAGGGTTFGGGTTQTGNCWNWRLMFWSRMSDGKTSFQSTTKQTINGIRCYGDNVWGAPNTLMQKDHLYYWDIDMHATFPAAVKAPNGGFYGDLTGTVSGHSIASDVPANAKFTDTTYTANTMKLVTTTVPNVTSVGSAPTLGTAIAADDITAWNAGSVPTLGTAIDADDITEWTTNTPTTASVSKGVLTITAGSAASLSYTARSIPNVTSVGTAPSLSYTARSIPNVTSVGSAPTLGTAITVATGSTASNGGGATVATGITAS